LVPRGAYPALSRVAYCCYCSALFCLLEACICCSLWTLDTLMDMIIEWKPYIFIFISNWKRGYIAPKFSNLDQMTTWMVLSDCHF
jgi:hypothetical protein